MPATPYPSTIEVSGFETNVARVSVSLHRFSHTAPEDVDILLVDPGEQDLIIMSDAGGLNPATNLTITFDDQAANPLPQGTADRDRGQPAQEGRVCAPDRRRFHLQGEKEGGRGKKGRGRRPLQPVGIRRSACERHRFRQSPPQDMLLPALVTTRQDPDPDRPLEGELLVDRESRSGRHGGSVARDRVAMGIACGKTEERIEARL